MDLMAPTILKQNAVQSISHYNGNLGDNVNWLERLPLTAKIFPVTVQVASIVSGTDSNTARKVPLLSRTQMREVYVFGGSMRVHLIAPRRQTSHGPRPRLPGDAAPDDAIGFPLTHINQPTNQQFSGRLPSGLGFRSSP